MANQQRIQPKADGSRNAADYTGGIASGKKQGLREPEKDGDVADALTNVSLKDRGTLMVLGLPRRSSDLPTTTRIQPSLMQYSSTLVRSAPLKRMPTPRSSRLASWYGLRGSRERRSGNVSVMRQG